MIARISGQIATQLSDRVIIDVHGLGYEVFLSAPDLSSSKEGEPATFEIYEQIREDTHNLFGFTDPGAKTLFTYLIGVSGVGPKVAMAILSAASLDQLHRAVISGDPELLRGVAGVGPKTAQRIMVELKGKLGSLGSTPASLATDSAYQALVGLGYPTIQAAEAVANLPASLTDEQERIKAALKGLTK
jgi:holliday junction DNA helicase RuvA